jgi:hypothetical protein
MPKGKLFLFIYFVAQKVCYFWSLGREDLSIYKVYPGEKTRKFKFIGPANQAVRRAVSLCAPRLTYQQPTAPTCVWPPRHLPLTSCHHHLLAVPSRVEPASGGRDPTPILPAIKAIPQCPAPLSLLLFPITGQSRAVRHRGNPAGKPRRRCTSRQARPPEAASHHGAALWQGLKAEHHHHRPESKDSPPPWSTTGESHARVPPSISSQSKPPLTSLLSSSSYRRMPSLRRPLETCRPPWMFTKRWWASASPWRPHFHCLPRLGQLNEPWQASPPQHFFGHEPLWARSHSAIFLFPLRICLNYFKWFEILQKS